MYMCVCIYIQTKNICIYVLKTFLWNKHHHHLITCTSRQLSKQPYIVLWHIRVRAELLVVTCFLGDLLRGVLLFSFRWDISKFWTAYIDGFPSLIGSWIFFFKHWTSDMLLLFFQRILRFHCKIKNIMLQMKHNGYYIVYYIIFLKSTSQALM